MNARNITLRRTAAAVFAVAALAAGSAQAQSQPWTTVGSAGTVDDADMGIADLALGEARVRGTAAAGSVLNIRYNVVSLPGFSGPGQYVLRTRFRDNGADARVQLALRRYNAATGTTTQLAAFDSNAHPPAVGYQMRSQCVLVSWDFVAGPHYIEATLTKSGAAGTPAVGTIQLVPGNCVP
jgi:hypothetical protein